MITPDSLPLWLAIPAIVVGWSWLIAVAIRSITADPHPEYSRLDCLDGLDSRTD